MALHLPPTLFNTIFRRNMIWLETCWDEVLIRATCNPEHFTAPLVPGRRASATLLEAALDALDSACNETRGGALCDLLGATANVHITDECAVVRFAEIRDTCRKIVKLGGLPPICAALTRAIAVAVGSASPSSSGVAHVSAGATLLTWVLCVHLDSEDFCADTARYLVDSTSCALLLALAGLLRVAATQQLESVHLPLRGACVLLRLVLRLSVLGPSARVKLNSCIDAHAYGHSAAEWTNHAASRILGFLFDSDLLEALVSDFLLLLLASAPNLKSYNGRVNLYGELDPQHIRQQDLFRVSVAPDCRPTYDAVFSAAARARHRDIVSWSCADTLLLIVRHAKLLGGKYWALVVRVLRRDNGPLLFLKYLSQDICGYLSETEVESSAPVFTGSECVLDASAIASAQWASLPGSLQSVRGLGNRVHVGPVRDLRHHNLFVVASAYDHLTACSSREGPTSSADACADATVDASRILRSLSNRFASNPSAGDSPVHDSTSNTPTARPILESLVSSPSSFLEGTARGLQSPARGSILRLSRDAPPGPDQLTAYIAACVLATAAGLDHPRSLPLAGSFLSSEVPCLNQEQQDKGLDAAHTAGVEAARAAQEPGLGFELDEIVRRFSLLPSLASSCMCPEETEAVPGLGEIKLHTSLQSKLQGPCPHSTAGAVVLPVTGRPVSHRRLSILCSLLRVLHTLAKNDPEHFPADLYAFKAHVVLSRTVNTGIIPLAHYGLRLLRLQLPYIPVWARSNLGLVWAMTRLLKPSTDSEVRSSNATRSLIGPMHSGTAQLILEQTFSEGTALMIPGGPGTLFRGLQPHEKRTLMQFI